MINTVKTEIFLNIFTSVNDRLIVARLSSSIHLIFSLGVSGLNCVFENIKTSLWSVTCL